jgi:hypothetical protein
MPLDKAEFEINEGIAQVTAALGDGGGLSPFFRIPGLLRARWRRALSCFATSSGLEPLTKWPTTG